MEGEGSVKIATVALTIAGLSARFGKGDGPSRLPSLFAALFSSPVEGAPVGCDTSGVSGVVTRASCCGQDTGGTLATWDRLFSKAGPVPAAAASDDFAVARFDARESRTLRMGSLKAVNAAEPSGASTRLGRFFCGVLGTLTLSLFSGSSGPILWACRFVASTCG